MVLPARRLRHVATRMHGCMQYTCPRAPATCCCVKPRARTHYDTRRARHGACRAGKCRTFRRRWVVHNYVCSKSPSAGDRTNSANEGSQVMILTPRPSQERNARSQWSGRSMARTRGDGSVCPNVLPLVQSGMPVPDRPIRDPAAAQEVGTNGWTDPAGPWHSVLSGRWKRAGDKMLESTPPGVKGVPREEVWISISV